jgi:hypothetical protein
VNAVGLPPGSCAHDHNGVVAVSTASSVVKTQPFTDADVADLPVSMAASPITIFAFELRSSKTPPPFSLRGFASPVRV